MNTSSMAFASRAGLRSRRAFNANAARSSALTEARPPPYRPIGVRIASQTNAWFTYGGFECCFVQDMTTRCIYPLPRSPHANNRTPSCSGEHPSGCWAHRVANARIWHIGCHARSATSLLLRWQRENHATFLMPYGRVPTGRGFGTSGLTRHPGPGSRNSSG